MPSRQRISGLVLDSRAMDGQRVLEVFVYEPGFYGSDSDGSAGVLFSCHGTAADGPGCDPIPIEADFDMNAACVEFRR